MNEQEIKNTKIALDHLCLSLRQTRNFGDESNKLLELNLINRKGCKDMWGNPLPDGLYVRPVWSRNPQRNDGYYDICVEACSEWGVLCTVFEALRKHA